MNFLQVSGITKIFNHVPVVKDLHFSVDASHRTAIAGETGSGKSTLLKMIAGLEQPNGGKIIFEGKRVIGPDEQLLPGHPAIGYLSQQFELRNNYRVEELLSYANALGDAGAKMLFEVCRIDHLVKRKTDQLSGGEKQRIALARLLVASPRLLLLDEPFSNIDPIHKTILKEVLQEIGDHLQLTCIITSHDPLDTLSWANEILVMHKGMIIQKGSPQKVYHQPVNEYAGGLFGPYNLLTSQEASVFPGIAETVAADKQLFIRPEQFALSFNSAEGVAGEIQKINFCGAYYELVISVSTQSILVKTLKSGYQKGDRVYVSVVAEPV